MRTETWTERCERMAEIEDTETGEITVVPTGEYDELTVTALYAETGKVLCREGVRLGTHTVLGTADSADAYTEVDA